MSESETTVIADAIADSNHEPLRMALRLAPEPEPEIPEDVVVLTLPRILGDPGSLRDGLRFVLMMTGERRWELKREAQPA